MKPQTIFPGFLIQVLLHYLLFNYKVLNVNLDEIEDPPGQPAEPSDQGNIPVCTAHAVSKAIVDLLNDSGYNCNQDEILWSLINLKQAGYEAQWPDIYNDCELALQIFPIDSGNTILLFFFGGEL